MTARAVNLSHLGHLEKAKKGIAKGRAMYFAGQQKSS
jgi:hypothetical protein